LGGFARGVDEDVAAVVNADVGAAGGVVVQFAGRMSLSFATDGSVSPSGPFAVLFELVA
jgi:hypothetical protein